MTSNRREDDLLEVLACDIGARPRGAPTIDDLLPSVRRVERTSDALTVEFLPVAADMVEACIDAERHCCADIRWELERGTAPRLRVTATPAQIEALEQMFNEQG